MVNNGVESVDLLVTRKNVSDVNLEVPLRFRAKSETVDDLDRAEAFFQGQGYRHVSRSHLVRVAIDFLMQTLDEEHPEIGEINLPR
ncbi:MAG: hypothetical protein JWO54_558 [Candidatus Saccharibacteria bacterium]|nr:hypothetical protein [Candidatus Saccharibacteria bacterium]MDB5180798.1 hypothetical protein [Candidatus Saccharibacteria bacterium]